MGGWNQFWQNLTNFNKPRLFGQTSNFIRYFSFVESDLRHFTSGVDKELTIVLPEGPAIMAARLIVFLPLVALALGKVQDQVRISSICVDFFS